MKQYVSAQIDDLVQADPDYVKSMGKLLIRMGDPNVQKQMDDLYYHIREKDGCAASKKESEAFLKTMPMYIRRVLKGGGCGLEMNAMLAKSFSTKANIVFETTGHTYPSWLIGIAKRLNYRIIMTYTLADFQTLLRRNNQRMKDAISEFRSGKKKLAPRLPDITPSVFHSRFNKVRQMLLFTIWDDKLDDPDDGIDCLYVFENMNKLKLSLVVKPRMNLQEKQNVLRDLFLIMARA